MRKKLLSIVLFCVLAFANYLEAQETTELQEVQHLAKQMFVDMNNRDFDAILNITHPKVFNLLPKETMKQFLKSMFEGGEEFSIEIPKIIPNYKVSEIFNSEVDSLKYAFVSYDMNMKMTFKNQEFDEEAKNLMLTMMKAKGMEVAFVTNNSVDVTILNSVTIILKDNETNNKWVMVNYDPDSPLFYQIVPSILMEKAKLYKQDLMLERKKNTEN